MSAIPPDAATTDFDNNSTGDDGVDAFLKTFLPPDASKKEPSEGKPESKEEPKPEETAETEETSEETLEETEEKDGSEEETKETARKYADDEGTYVKIKVGEEEHEVPVKDLKRLFGQEASLTQKSQQVAEERKKADETLAKNVAATDALLQRAKARFEPYSKVDFLLASQQLSPEEYTALRNEAMKAHEDVQFLEQHLGAYMQQINTQQQTSLRERARETLKELSGDDPVKSIQGFDEKAYNELRVFATTKLGVPNEIMDNLVDSWAFRVLHKAMLYDKGKTSVVTTKVNKTPKKIVKTTTTSEASRSSNASGSEKAMKKLAQSGSTDDAADAFLARWNDDA